MVPNWRVLNDGWVRLGTGAERWFESPDVAIADTGYEGEPFLVNPCVSGQVLE